MLCLGFEPAVAGWLAHLAISAALSAHLLAIVPVTFRTLETERTIPIIYAWIYLSCKIL